MDTTYMLIGLIIIFFAILTIFKIFGTKKEPVLNLYPLADYYLPIDNITTNPNILEINLTASEVDLEINGVISPTYTYNKLFPGPLIKGRIGQQLIIHFKNDLLFPTNLEFYGYPISNKTCNHLDKLVLPGSETSYVIILNKPGLYLYRAGRSSRNQQEQISNGLYGVLSVKDDIQNHRLGLPLEENIVVISDIYQDDMINSETKHLFLVNGIKEGVIEVERNVLQRIGIINSSCNEIYSLILEDTEFMRIGGDQGLCEEPVFFPKGKILILTPGERADVVFLPKNDAIQLQTNEIPLVTFISIGMKEDSNNSIKKKIRSRLISIPRITPKETTSLIDITYNNNFNGNDNFNITMNSSYNRDGYILKDGTYIFEISNKTQYVQNFHVSGLSFQHVLTTSINNTFTEESSDSDIYSSNVIENKDTIIVLPNSKIVVLIKIPKNIRRNIKSENTKGRKYYFGTNILYYSQRGLSSYFTVI